ncbi:MAG: tetratricopeptide repeat protein [Candidatus Zixiibacteriota bacterium]|nr:MAG: tetratricopeptide repeat protein [candidate division Zixibacteria bacterium]
MRRVGFLLILLVGMSGAAAAAPPDLAAAEQLYREGDYRAAAEAYHQVLNQGLASGEIYYNLGNCYYKLGDYGRAILHYERARRWLGQDSDLDLNLQLANLKVPDRIEPLPRFFLLRLVEGLGDLLASRRWALLVLLCEWVLLACLAGLLIVRRPKHRRLLAGVFVAAGFLFLVSGGFYLQQSARENQPQGVVLSDRIDVLSAPEAGATELFALHEGVKFRILRRVPGWAEIHLADGKRGWMPQSAFESI